MTQTAISLKSLKFAMHMKTDGSVTELSPANGKTFTLEELQKAVGGYIEFVRLHSGKERVAMVVNEEGLLQQLPVNQLASELACQLIVGDVVVGPSKMLDG